jgi:hypothetical protein
LPDNDHIVSVDDDRLAKPEFTDAGGELNNRRGFHLLVFLGTRLWGDQSATESPAIEIFRRVVLVGYLRVYLEKGRESAQH